MSRFEQFLPVLETLPSDVSEVFDQDDFGIDWEQLKHYPTDQLAAWSFWGDRMSAWGSVWDSHFHRFSTNLSTAIRNIKKSEGFIWGKDEGTHIVYRVSNGQLDLWNNDLFYTLGPFSELAIAFAYSIFPPRIVTNFQATRLRKEAQVKAAMITNFAKSTATGLARRLLEAEED